MTRSYCAKRKVQAQAVGYFRRFEMEQDYMKGSRKFDDLARCLSSPPSQSSPLVRCKVLGPPRSWPSETADSLRVRRSRKA